MSRFRFESDSDLLGAHMSTKGGVSTIYGRAEIIKANAVALFTKNSNQWKAKPLTDEERETFSGERTRTGVVPAISHASYLINLATTNDEFLAKSKLALIDELQRAEFLGLSAVVLHPGAHMGAGVDKGLDQIARSLDEIHAAIPDCKVVTLLETAAGQGTCVGCTFEELGTILRLVDDRSRVGVCVDTCHIFAAGYDIRTERGWEETVERIAEHVGVDDVGAFHINDSKKGLGSHVDRHEHIGAGELGLDAFAAVLNDERFRGIMKVLETPKTIEHKSDIKNLKKLRALLNMKSDRKNTTRIRVA